MFVLKPFLRNKHSQNSKIKCFPFIFGADGCKATSRHLCNLRHRHRNYPSSITVQISPLPDCSTNGRPYRKKLQVHDLTELATAKHSSPKIVITAVKSMDTKN